MLPKDLKERTKIGNVVKEYVIEDEHGKCRIRICDDCCRNTTKEEIEARLKRIAQISTEIYIEKAMREKAMQEKEEEAS